MKTTLVGLLLGGIAVGSTALPPAGAAPFFSKTILFHQEEGKFYHIPSLVTAPDGTLLAFCNQRCGSAGDDVGEARVVLRRSLDNGATWLPMQELAGAPGKKFHLGTAMVDETTGTVLLSYGDMLARSRDGGATWTQAPLQVLPNSMGLKGHAHGSSTGITLRYGTHRGRLLLPARTHLNPYNDTSIPDRRNKCFSCTLYSDDHGDTWQTGECLLPGTGEVALVERDNGDIFFNARAYFDDGKRRVAVSHDSGKSFPQAEWGEWGETVEPNQGVNASMIRVPASLTGGREMALFCNPASRGGASPEQAGGLRQNGVVRLSLDGGRTWPYAKVIQPQGNWFDYCSLAVARDGTILCLFKTVPSLTGMGHWNEVASMAIARFNLEWLTDRKVTTSSGQ